MRLESGISSEPPRNMLHNDPITTIAALSALVESLFKDDKETTVLYRGHGAASFKLHPKVGRFLPTPNATKKIVNESLMLELFRRQSIDRIAVPVVTDWELLAIPATRST